MSVTYPARWERVVEFGTGGQVCFRPVKPSDDTMMEDFFYSLSERSIYSRFFAHLKFFPLSFLHRFTVIDYEKTMTVVGLTGDGDSQSIISVGHYVVGAGTHKGEVAMIVRDDWQNKGTGSFLLNYLVEIARESGLDGFFAEVLKNNKPMIRLLGRMGFSVSPGYGKSSSRAELNFADAHPMACPAGG